MSGRQGFAGQENRRTTSLERVPSLESNVTDPEIASFIRAFEDCSLPKSEWTHTRHLVMALWYLRRHRREEATRLIRDGIQRV